MLSLLAASAARNVGSGRVAVAVVIVCPESSEPMDPMHRRRVAKARRLRIQQRCIRAGIAAA